MKELDMNGTGVQPGPAMTREESTPSHRPLPTAWRNPLYITILLLIPCLFLGSSIIIVRSASFPVDSADPFLLNADYAFDLRHVDCDVVVFGDSTAVTGINPTVVERVTGLKTCNIGQSQSVMQIVGMKALDVYLKNNKPPKYLVLQLAPETFSRKRHDYFWPEGLTVLMRQGPAIKAAAVLIRHPVEAYDFAIWAIKAKVTAMQHAPPDFSQTEQIFQATHGLLILPKPASQACSKKWAYYDPTPDWITELRQRYTTANTQVLVNISPIPACSDNLARIASSTRGITDNALPVYPIQMFCDLDRHLTLEGAKRASEEIGHQLMTREAQGH